MTATSVDTFANTNPAFCALVLRSFVEGYTQVDSEGVSLPLLLFPLPMVLSTDIATLFAGTNVNTGLLTWVGRYPQVTIELRLRVERSARFSREALFFGLVRRALGISEQGRIVLDEAGLVKKVKFPPSQDRGRALANARQLGHWVADVRSTETVYASMGMNR